MLDDDSTLMTKSLQKNSPGMTTRIAAILLLLVPAGKLMSADKPDPTYADIAPVLGEKCVICHSGENAPLGLRLDSLDAVLQGSQNGAVVKAGDPAASELIRRLKGTSQPRMPMTGPPFLPDEQIAVFENWISAGLKRGEVGDTATAAPPAPVPATEKTFISYLDVAPIFATRCAKCHAEKGLMGSAPEGYRLNSYDATLATADRVRVVPGSPDASELVRRLRGQARPRMPFDGPPYLSSEEIRLIEDWISQGARNSEGVAAELPTGASVRLHGTLRPDWHLDELPLSVSARTRIDKSPSTGDYVEVRGRLAADGSVNVNRLRRR